MNAEVGRAWQISPICRLLVEVAFVLDGTMRFHDKPQGRSVLRDATRVGPTEVRQITMVVKVDVNFVAMVPQRHSEENGRCPSTAKSKIPRGDTFPNSFFTGMGAGK